MRFGAVPVREAEGALLAHSLAVPGGVLKKGRRLSAEDVRALQAAGLEEIIAASLDADDIHEDAAADRLAAACAGPHVSRSAAFTGRCNLYAETKGLAILDRARVDAFNLIHEAVTVATVNPFEVVEPRQMLATIKIIPFAAPAPAVEACMKSLGNEPLIRVAPFVERSAGVILTSLPNTKESVLDSTVATLTRRLEALDNRLHHVIRCPHTTNAVVEAVRDLRARGCDPILIFGASATVDRRDVLPAAVEAAGGAVLHYGMPVDPGNLLFLGTLDGADVVGMPGCGRSPKLNGFDWVLERLCAGVAVTREDIMRMGVGGLLKEISVRPLPRAEAVTSEPKRAGKARAPRIAALVLAAGQSRRMGATNKLLAEVAGKPMVAHVVDAATASRAAPVLVVTGHEADRVGKALGGRAVTIVGNPDFAEGLSTSLRAGLKALSLDVDGVLVCLGDMPLVTAEHINRLIAAFDPDEGRLIVVPTFGGKRGNPVLFARRFFPEMQEVSGDTGARHLIGAHGDMVCEVELSDDAVLVDVDTPAALRDLAP